MTTKADIISDALRELGVVTPNQPAQPDDLLYAQRRLERLMASLDSMGYQLSYAFGDDINAESGLRDWAEGPVITLLARSLLSYFAMPLSDPLAADSKAAYTALAQNVVQVPELAFNPQLAIGQGYQYSNYAQRFFVNVDNLDVLGG